MGNGMFAVGAFVPSMFTVTVRCGAPYKLLQPNTLVAKPLVTVTETGPFTLAATAALLPPAFRPRPPP